METALAIDPPAAEALSPALRGRAPPRAEFPPFAPAELRAWFRSGAPELEDLEALLVWGAGARRAFDVVLAEGLAALCQGQRLEALGCHLDDYAREALDLGRSAARAL